MRPMLTAFLIAFLLSAGLVRAQSFSYYMLVLSYAPDFCAEPGGNKDFRECGTGRKVGFIVHGLWPQGDNSRGPENCGGEPGLAGDHPGHAQLHPHPVAHPA